MLPGINDCDLILCSIVKSFVKHAKDVSRIAPYLLLSTINLLVSDDQPTTNNPKVSDWFGSEQTNMP